MGGVESKLSKPISVIEERLKASLDTSNSPTTFETMCRNLVEERMNESDKSELARAISRKESHEVLFGLIYRHTSHITFTPSSAETEKSEEKATILRESGNEEFKRKKYHDALSFYTQSIAVAPFKSESNALAKGYSNRSAVLKALGLFLNSISDINDALRSGYPESLKYKILTRKGHCWRLIGVHDEAINTLSKAHDMVAKSQLSADQQQALRCQISEDLQVLKDGGTTHVNVVASCSHTEAEPIPVLQDGLGAELRAASSCVTLRYNEARGRHLVATRDIQPGEVLLSELPYTSILLPEFRFSHCGHCLQRCHVLLPCPTCAWAMFCSHRCRELSWSSYHRVECPAMTNIQRLNLRTFEPAHLAVRTLARTGLENVLAYHRSKDATPGSSPEGQRTRGFNPSGHFVSSEFGPVYHQSAKATYKTSFLIGRVLLAVCLLKTLRLENRPDAVEIGGVLLRLMCGHSMNAHEMYERFKGPTDLITKDIGASNGIYPTLGLVNHSCDQNAVRHFHGKTVVLRAIGLIREGEEILDTYGPHFVADQKVHRQQMLEVHSHFTCRCRACTNDWPTQERLPWSLPPPQGVAGKELSQSHAKVKQAVEGYVSRRELWVDDVPNLCKHLALMDRLGLRLCQEYFTVQEIVKVVFATQGNSYRCQD